MEPRPDPHSTQQREAGTESAMERAHALFLRSAERVAALCGPAERFLLGFEGEESDFVRFNRALVRQAGHVSQWVASVDLLEPAGSPGDTRHTTGSTTLTGDAAEDADRLARLIATLRAQRTEVQADPYLLYSESTDSLLRLEPSTVPTAHEVAGEILELAQGLDLVGIWASGAVSRGFASSFGQRSFHAIEPFVFDWSCYAQGDKAVKQGYSGTHYERAVLANKLYLARRDVTALGRPAKRLAPGRYRAYLAPSAVEELWGLLAWDSFSEKSIRGSSSALRRLAEGRVALDPRVGLVEDRTRGWTPRFTPQGFAKAASVPLIHAGRWVGGLVSPRSAREYGLPITAGGEAPECLSMAPGELPAAEVLAQLGTGLLINNLWYCNYSDRNGCRITGMTRFACFWVEGGELVAPLDVMRFDDSLYELLGGRLAALTRERELLPSTSTYGGRSTNTMELPGLLVHELALTV
jgi:predicted Zn-dependent protease